MRTCGPSFAAMAPKLSVWPANSSKIVQPDIVMKGSFAVTASFWSPQSRLLLIRCAVVLQAPVGTRLRHC